MSLTVNLYYTGKNGSAKRFIEAMINKGIVAKIKAQPGNLKYDYFISYDDPETVLLIDSWINQEALDKHHASEMMQDIAALRDKYDLYMKMERYQDDNTSHEDDHFLRT
ncbi:antibiotic biosynthesis monooxygenase [Staphylococcus sp. ACRSN]|uniref:putative quinol monooxygenase n=1 Tax=Staphylococcus sp. ACRSN TaxID=2918214 RepID=UPI001EF319F5|nr:putative quinol monooxygenase [Staphylococcus sp. ACRSN]MCG7340087.1 antibiotic biosynthesis monooxygenase [Staphylococcus sp. ACRSN]